MDRNFHNTLASIYYNEGIYLIPKEELYVEIKASQVAGDLNPIRYMQFIVSDEFTIDDDVENFTFPYLATEALISWFINSEYNDSIFVSYKLNKYSQKYYMAIMMNFWSRGIYTLADYNPELFQFRFYNPPHSEL